METKLKFILIIICLILFCKLLVSQEITTIDEKGNICTDGVLQSKIKVTSKSLVRFIDVNFNNSIIEVINFSSKKISYVHYYGSQGNFIKNAVIIDYRSLTKNDIFKIDSLKSLDILFLYEKVFLKSGNEYINSVSRNKIIYDVFYNIQIFEQDSVYILIKGHNNIKQNMSVASPRFYDNGKKVAYLKGDEFTPNRYVVFFDIVKNEEIKKIEVSKEAILMYISKDGNSFLFYVPSNKKYMYDIYYQSIENTETRYIGCYKAARID